MVKRKNQLLGLQLRKYGRENKILTEFQIKEEFLLDGQPFKILSGAIHYFRLHPTQWERSLYNLKALGFNTVETYIPWNLHEKQPGVFDFSEGLDIERFLQLAQDIGLYAIVRPSPYICAEWEFGGFPAWLLTKNIRIRSSDSNYLAYVAQYYAILLPKLRKHLLTNNGNILMLQLENEYGSYGEDKEYLHELKKLIEKQNINVPLFTSDGSWQATLNAGSLIEEDVLVTGNFGSKATENFANMQKFFDTNGKKWPLMCMEFWDGWFNRWHEPIIKRDPEELARAVKEALSIGSISLYMFHGGTNFGFMNGCSARKDTDLPQVTSYDYDAPLDQAGNPTQKYYALQQMLTTNFPEIKQMKPKVQSAIQLHNIPLKNKVSLFETLDSISKPICSKYPQTMEELGQNTGYLLYRTTFENHALNDTLRIIDGRDRVLTFLSGSHQSTQYQSEIGEDISLNFPQNRSYTLDLLIENMGRVNYGHKLFADTQKKGIRTGVMLDLHFMTNWQQYCLPLDTVKSVDFSRKWFPNQPAFYQFDFELSELGDTHIHLDSFGKGIVFVNDINIGRFWEVGPILSLYVPEGLLKIGKNELIIFETEGTYADTLNLEKKQLEKENF